MPTIAANRSEACASAPGVIDVTLHDLAFDVTETDELMSAYGLDLDLEHDRRARRPVRRMAGGPQARSARSPRRRRTVPGRSLSDLADAAFVVDYLRSEWAGRLPPDEMDFLTEAACLERFTGAMCDRILGRLGSGPLLRRMHRADMVVTSLDSRDEWYRMHPLLARWLSSELRGADIDRWRQIHVNAAAWFAAAWRHRSGRGSCRTERRPRPVRGARRGPRSGLPQPWDGWHGSEMACRIPV